ncbi:MAG: hypothetical protein OIF58_16820, partial [Cohaesibacter sp.]|nr:hypothetical protein [Cohaesibacter sp.]
QDRQWHSNLQQLGQQGGQEGYNQALQTFKKASKLAIAKQRRGSLWVKNKVKLLIPTGMAKHL